MCTIVPRTGFLLGGPMLSHRKRSEKGRSVGDERFCLLFPLAPFLKGYHELTVSLSKTQCFSHDGWFCLPLGSRNWSLFRTWPRQDNNLGLPKFSHPTLLLTLEWIPCALNFENSIWGVEGGVGELFKLSYFL